MTDLRRVALLQAAHDLAELAKRKNAKVHIASFRAQDRWEKRWERWASGVLDHFFEQLPLEEAVATAHNAWGHTGFFVRKESRPNADDIKRKLRQPLDEHYVDGAVNSYVGIALDMGEDAGQYALDALGLNKTFAWAHPRAMGRDMFAVRGSKIIHHMYGYHVDRLSNIILKATDPRHPMTIQEVVKAIREEWPDVSRKNALRIARTETAAVWETTNFNTMRANGITRFKWSIASGPSIGVRTHPVCPTCLARAAHGPYTTEQLLNQDVPIPAPPGVSNGLPPAHPNCRCTILPILDGWLPPAQPFNGGDDLPLPTPENPGPPVALRGAPLNGLLDTGVPSPFDDPNFNGWVPKLVGALNQLSYDVPAAFQLGITKPLQAVPVSSLILPDGPPVPGPMIVLDVAGALYLISGQQQAQQQAEQGETEVQAHVVQGEEVRTTSP